VIEQYIKQKSLLEIGGPSRLLIGLYPPAKDITFLNLPSSMAVHSQHSYPPNTIKVANGDASNERSFIDNELFGKFDLLITSHTLEHFANPIKALMLWKRCLVRGGIILNIVPNKLHCWDRNREYTTFEHILSDYETNMEENDMTHLHESSCMVETRPSYYQDVGDRNESRVIHHHVYSTEVLAKCHEYCGFKTLGSYVDNHDQLQMIYIGHSDE
jgi:SAM-dependent methyltransferase